MNRRKSPREWDIALFAALLATAGCVTPTDAPEYDARILRTDGGIPHIVADDLGGLGFGTLFAMAEDNLCILADQYMTFAAERSLHHGPGDGNLERDFLYKLLIDRGDATEPLPAEFDDLFRGAAAGYNHYLRATDVPATDSRARKGRPRVAVVDGLRPRDARCADAAWVEEIEALDVKRVSRIDYALAYMLPILVEAAPPGALDAEPEEIAQEPDTVSDPIEIAAAIAEYLEVPKQGGSNGIALGRAITRNRRGMLLANPHMPWNEPFQRFYPMHQTIPGVSNVIGANLIGRPRVGFGHTDRVAWTSTVSTAKRLSFYRLELTPGDPTKYVFDGEVFPMKQRRVEVRVRLPDGGIETRAHTFFSTHFGAQLVESPIFAWTEKNAFAVRLVDAGWRGETSLAEQYAANSVRELKAVHDAHQFLPVNLVAADRHGSVLYADPGPIPNLADEVLADCAVLHGAALDGARSECQWATDEDAAAAGIFAPAQLPALFRDDYVTNSNDSYWLANPAAPLEGFPKSLGSERTKRTLRTRSGLAMVGREIAKGQGIELSDLQRLALANENIAGQLIRDDLVALCRAQPKHELDTGRVVDLAKACDVLEAWDLHANLESRGAHVFRQFLNQARGTKYIRYLPDSFIPRVAYDPERPVETPSGLAAKGNEGLLGLLAQAVAALEDSGIALDAKLGDLQSVTRGEERIPIHGGPENEGVFNKIEASFRGVQGYPDVDRWSSSWILAVAFEATGPRSQGILTYSISDDPMSPHHSDQTRNFAAKKWVSIPFRADHVERKALRSYRVSGSVRPPADRDVPPDP